MGSILRHECARYARASLEIIGLSIVLFVRPQAMSVPPSAVRFRLFCSFDRCGFSDEAADDCACFIRLVAEAVAGVR
jgi:hypothetical protein